MPHQPLIFSASRTQLGLPPFTSGTNHCVWYVRTYSRVSEKATLSTLIPASL
jgi:hypothetical protein